MQTRKRQNTWPEPQKTYPPRISKPIVLDILDEVAKTGLPLIVTKRGKPLAKLVPLDSMEPPNLLGSVRYKREQDLLSPVTESWEIVGRIRGA